MLYKFLSIISYLLQFMYVNKTYKSTYYIVEGCSKN
jgi:hypothetical protein